MTPIFLMAVLMSVLLLALPLTALYRVLYSLEKWNIQWTR